MRREAAQILGPDKPIKQVGVGGFFVRFADGMQWNSGGRYVLPDLTMEPEDYFPGNANAPWWHR